jgi:O-antigen ligase
MVWAPAVAILYGMLLTRSRGGLIALLAVFFYAFRQRLGRVLSAALAGGLALTLIAIGFTGGRALSGDESSNSRIGSWYDGIQMLKGSPIWGVGFGNYRGSHDLVAHNSFVHCFSETGLVGYFLWLWLITITFTEVLTLSKRSDESSESTEIALWGRALHLAFVGFLLAALFLSRTYSPVLFLILGLGTALSDMARRGSHPAMNTSALRSVPWVVGLEVASVFLVWLSVRSLG